MPFYLVYTKRAQKDIKKLDNATRAKIGKEIKKLEQNPFSKVKKLVNSEIGDYRFRVGDYRIIFDIVGGDIVILRVGNRKDIYR